MIAIPVTVMIITVRLILTTQQLISQRIANHAILQMHGNPHLLITMANISQFIAEGIGERGTVVPSVIQIQVITQYLVVSIATNITVQVRIAIIKGLAITLITVLHVSIVIHREGQMIESF